MHTTQMARRGIWFVVGIVQNQMNDLKFSNESKVSIDWTQELKRWCHFDYIQDNILVGQGNLKNFLFKMSTYGLTNDINTMKCI
jgi:hypothetical protein